VTGEVGDRSIEWETGPTALEYTRDSQRLDDPDAANRSGWNCRVHVEYEGRPAVDWYIPAGTPVFATMDGTATLYAITTANGFDYYDVPREPYLGNPDRQRAGIDPFPGPSGGTGVYVEVDSGLFLTVSAHLDLRATARAVPPGAFYAGYSTNTDFATLFSDISADGGAAIAQWQVRRGDLIGYSGDAGYSEAPHLHYTVQRSGSNALLCPTAEAGFEDGGWLLK
jgi:murein DD-endopeptidase MepM/ murein hydrolase activator NlpD